MFAKPYKLKSNNTLKNSEKKHLAQRIQNEFPAATDEKIKELVPVKSNSSCMKLVLHSGETVGVFVVDGVPMMIELAESLVPTVCALWKVPDLVPTVIIHSLVLPKVQGGAPLYAPGVVTGGSSCPQFARNTILAACTSDNAAAGIVGRAVMSSADLLYKSMGVCLETYHVFGDLLCKDPKFSKIERLNLGPPSHSDITDNITADIGQLSIQTVKEEWPSLGKQRPLTPAVNEPKVIQDEQEKETVEEQDETELNDTVCTENSEVEEDPIPEDMDGLLRWCLLSFLKLEGKNLQLPLKTNLLYKNHLFPLCPADRTLDVKKSTYKKMGKFLEAMQREGLLEVRELEKGVDAVVAVHPQHPFVRSHRAAAPRAAPAQAEGGAEYAPPRVREMFCVTAGVAELFMPLRKGTALSASEIRSTLTEYVKSKNLNSTQIRGAVVLDATLAKAAGKKEQEQVKWEELMTSILSRFTPSTELRFADGSVKLNKARIEPIKMQVVTRSGNKKVTLVSNLEAFGLRPAALAAAGQRGAAAACGVTRGAGARADQLMLQGDQTHFVAKLLIEKYGLPKKYVEGADKALNKKK